MALSINGTIERQLPNGGWVALALPSAFFDELDASALAGWLVGYRNQHKLPPLCLDPAMEVVGDIYTTFFVPVERIAHFNYQREVEDCRNYENDKADPLPKGRGIKTTYETLFGPVWMQRVAYFRMCNPKYRLRCWFY